MNIVCIGSGYVGSVTGAAFSALGYKTTVIDINESKVALLNSGQSPIYEPGLTELIRAYIGKTLFATTSYEAVKSADVIFIGVGTPSRPDGSVDLSYIKAAAGSIGKSLSRDRFTVIVNKSTVPVGTADLVSSIIEKESGLRAEHQFTVISNPEFLREGYALEDVFFPDRIIIGSVHHAAKDRMRQLYNSIVYREGYEAAAKYFYFKHNPEAPQAKYFETDTKSSEMIKYAANAFLAVKISYINEVARLCESLGANVPDVARGMGMDSRIGEKFLEVSSGWSGSCFPKDTAEFLHTSQQYGSELTLVKTAMQSNERMHAYVVEKIQHRLKSLHGKSICILGLTFKPNTDDARKTQASYIIARLIELGAHVKVHDPQGMEMFRSLNSSLSVEFCKSPQEAAEETDMVVLLTHWADYQRLDWTKVAKRMKHPFLFDTRNVLEHHEMERAGFQYEGLGLRKYQDLKVSELTKLLV
ncbi:UDP-glucose 6-dehydrogenase [Paenibacillus baekrokdamisoli]|uniref:UDP-glucose 6-dehydrogenase n=1 Tax=Paenibacillus baekrokdamisoli TaxID=1712516 RepID=A0A3G9ISL9_9BACL|nr:UDP-glucose/GDP-mannose dehydrogenase family protein [Paenibacillus baekrokdamisoli]MBB3071650.1 UDPglucose 6-dehydrogenase [Paenibacillus baekrokdamisoli]BBH21840.1 UDP-glucose 6-dehydrogenase [Paenibacillus baekrokdamisoli]